ncbi:MAG: hypothetical protein A2W91_15255 [Bacteroidetes bacterium GWF2_38_335]|nr:MAG: hypothetical protein A2W91_15255 [Bacteroidetes bacterium GWF2_38_335]OFY81064.1 MAG: hypothetical protein A2281_13225 [Bacteroidetes bacterium RIFOXYA12_FULL_38_20]HBS87619.1 hypothetical protein [Bacteroidales bacterium]
MVRTLILLLCLMVSMQVHSQEKTNEKVNIILVHPTVFALDAFDFLVSEKIIDVPGIHFIGVYYEKEIYDYSNSEKWLDKHNTGLFELKKIEGKISESEIYKENGLTEEFRSLFEKSSGIIFMGGDDIQPSLYGSKALINTEIEDPYRHIFEVSFLYHLVGGIQHHEFYPLISSRPNYVCLGICLGMQTMNVAAGGTLTQDIPLQIYEKKYMEDILSLPEHHSNYYNRLYPSDSLSSGNLHKIKISKELFGNYITLPADSTFSIYSSHHQCVDKLGSGFVPVAWSEDGKIVEAMRHSTFPNVIGVQFHPEKISLFSDKVKHRHYPKEPAGSYKAIIENRQERNVNKVIWSFFSFLLK